MAQEPTPSEQPKEPPKKPGIGSRLLVATAFSTLGAKIGTLGMIADANAAFEGQKLTLGEKIKGLFNGKLFDALLKKKEGLRKQGISRPRAYATVAKYWLALSTIGAIAGGIIGWIRGGEVENWKDIIHHPVKSSKLVFGIKPHAAAAPETAATAPPTPASAEETPAKWAESVQPRGTHAEEVAQEKTTSSPVLGA